MFAENALREIDQWRQRATTPQHQLDWRWVERYRKLASYDGHWWLAHAGPFTTEEQQQWDQLYSYALDDATKEKLSQLLVQSRQRELATAISERREPHLHYPAINITDVRKRIADLLLLDEEITQREPNAIVKRLYHGAIEEELDFLRLIEATYEGNTEQFWKYNRHLDPEPTPSEMEYALSHFRRILLRGLQRSDTKEAAEQVIQLMNEQLKLSLDLSNDNTFDRKTQSSIPGLALSTSTRRKVTAQTAQHFFQAALRESGFDGWQVKIDANASTPRIEQGLRYLFLPDDSLSMEQIRHFLAHELAGHVARCVAGERSPIGLLGIHTQHSLPIEEGLALYHERQTAMLCGEEFDDWRTWIGAFSVGLASGVVTPPQTFLSLFTFFESFFFLRRLLEGRDSDILKARERARRTALARCLRTYRGVPDLEKAGVCYTKDVVYLRGLRQIEQAVAEDETIINHLAIGVIAPEHLADLQELGIVAPPQPLRALAYDTNLESYVLSFEIAKENEKHA